MTDGELQQQLPDVQRVGPRAVVPLFQPQQLHLQPELLDLQRLDLELGLLTATGRVVALA